MSLALDILWKPKNLLVRYGSKKRQEGHLLRRPDGGGSNAAALPTPVELFRPPLQRDGSCVGERFLGRE
jgi:hypothetical protein